MNRFVDLSMEDYQNPDRLIDRFKGEPCFVVGAAPSLNQLDLKRLDGFLTIGINWTLELFAPTFLHVVDAAVVKKQSELILKNRQTQRLFRERVVPNWPQPCVWFKYRSGRMPTDNNPAQNIRMIKQPSDCFMFPGNSSWLAVNWAYVFGCNPIIMIGVDLDTKAQTADNPDQKVETHFWGNGLRKNAYSARSGFKPNRMDMFFRGALEGTFKPSGIEFLNASPVVNPQFNSIPRIDFEEAVEKYRP